MKQLEHTHSAALLLGPPGSGKTTFANVVAKNENIATIEAGTLLKKRLNSDAEIARQLKPHIENGEMVPTSLVKQVIADRLSQISDEHVVFDGFPRIEEQVAPFLDLLQANALELRSVVVLDLGLEESMERLSARRVCPECAAVYNNISEPPVHADICDRCGSTLIRREDDEPGIIRRRYEIYERETGPVIASFTRSHPELMQTQSATLSVATSAERIKQQLTKP